MNKKKQIPHIDALLWELNLLRVKTSYGKKHIWYGFGKNGEDLKGKEYNTYFSNLLGTPKYDNGIDYICYDRGMTPLQALKWWGRQDYPNESKNPKLPKVNKDFVKARKFAEKESTRLYKMQQKMEIKAKKIVCQDGRD